MWKWIKNIFKKQELPAPMPEIKPNTKKKIAIIIGHGAGDGGATGWNGVEEYSYNHKVANILLENVHNHELKLFYRTASGIVGVASRVVLWQPDISIELHCNAYNGEAFGCEVLCLKDDIKSGEMAKSFAANFGAKFNRKLRGDKGVKWIINSDRGYASLSALRPIGQSILVEPFFLDNKNEWIEPLTYAEFLAQWIVNKV